MYRVILTGENFQEEFQRGFFTHEEAQKAADAARASHEGMYHFHVQKITYCAVCNGEHDGFAPLSKRCLCDGGR